MSDETIEQPVGSLARPGAVEADDFTINDVHLKIPPQQIAIDKEAFNYQWDTLRSDAPQKTKSGYGLVSVSVTAIFEGNISINNDLVRLVGGLRATPFCVVSNRYLEQCLKETEVGNWKRDENKQYKEFTPIVLALTNLTISTIPQLPTCLQVSMNFIWFNYFPFTPIWAYRTGEDYTRPGNVTLSSLWQSFYKPFISKSKPIDWPQNAYLATARPTIINYREFAMAPGGNTMSNMAAIDLLNLIRSKPAEFFNAYEDLIRNNNVDLNSESIFDTMMLVFRDDPNISEAVRKKIGTDDLPASSITAALEGAAGSLVDRMYRRLNESDDRKNFGAFNNDHVAEINNAIATLQGRIQSLQQLESTGEFGRPTDTKPGDDKNSAHLFQPLEGLDLDVKHTVDGRTVNTGSLRIYGRKQYLNVSPQNGIILEGMTIHFRNTMAVIPMAGYRYPTIQHTGGSDVEVTLSLNCTNAGASRIHKTWDAIESMALRFKAIPQGYMNLWIQNDILGLFDLREFITQSLRTETIGEQPGRSMVELRLTQAGVHSLTRFDDPDVLNQEFVQGHESVWRQIDRILGSYVSNKATGYGEDYVKEDWQYYQLQITGTKNRPQDAAFNSILERYVEIANTWIGQLHRHLFQGNNWPWESSKPLIAGLMSLQETTPGFGYIPLIARIQKGVKDRSAEFSRLQKVAHQPVTEVEPLAVTQQRLNRAMVEENRLGTVSGTQEAIVEYLDDSSEALRDAGINDYLKEMRSLFDEVVMKHRALPQFLKADQLYQGLGVNKGMTAYPDFKQQLISVIGEVRGGSTKVQKSELLNYEPDCYMWYPIYDSGFINNDLSNFVDDSIINRAKELSLESYRNARAETGDFFQGEYRKMLEGTNVNGPKNKLEVNLKETGGKVAPNYYDAKQWQNATRSEQIVKTVIPDAHAHAHTNFPQKTPFSSTTMLQHVTDPESMWGGVVAGANPTSSQATTTTTAGEQQSTPAPTQATPAPAAAPSQQSGGGVPAGQGNYAKLDQVRPEFQGILKGILDDLTAQNFQPRIAQAYRSAAEQLEKFNQGRSKLAKPGPHNWGLAADIVDKRYGWPADKDSQEKWQAAASFFKALGVAAKKRGCEWGGSWEKKWRWKDFDLGWDPAHVQWRTTGKIDLKYRVDYMTGQATAGPGGTSSAALASPVSNDVTTTVASPMKLAIEQFQNDMLNGQIQSIRRAYPTFKLYFIEDDSAEKRMAFDDFFSYNAVRSIQVVRSREIAADLCIIELTNLSGTLSNRKFRQEIRTGDKPRTSNGTVAGEGAGPMERDTAKENPIASLLLQEGIQISLKMGYASDPDLLETVFNGVITEVGFEESDDLVTILAQSYGVELVQDIKGFQKPITKESNGLFGWDYWGFRQGASTARILTEMISCPEVLHFGRWDPRLNMGTFNRELLTDKWQFKPNTADDNLFPPPAEADLSLNNDLIFKNLKYIIYRTTIWDIFQEMTMRHPNFVALPVPYKARGQERMTMFFGLPNQLYFARDPSPEEEIAQEALRARREELEEQIYKRNLQDALASLGDMGSPIILDALSDSAEKNAHDKETIQKVQNIRLAEARQKGYIKPFRKYHLITSKQHIVSNNIKATGRDVANTITIKYGEYVDTDTGNPEERAAIAGDESDFTVSIDNALPTEEIRTEFCQFLNVTNVELARRYAIAMLMRNARKIYQGSLVLIGNPAIKPCDVCYLMDEHTDMVGPIEVEQVTHSFNPQSGFTTEIIPNMLVQAGEWSLLNSTEACALVAEGLFSKMRISGSWLAWTPLGMQYSAAISPTSAKVLGTLGGVFGGFISKKILQWTQTAQPLVMTPLVYKGRPFSGGVPTKKIPQSMWTTIFGKWTNDVSKGFDMWWEDKMDAIQIGLKSLGGIWGGGYTTGRFWNNDNTIETG